MGSVGMGSTVVGVGVKVSSTGIGITVVGVGIRVGSKGIGTAAMTWLDDAIVGKG